MASKYLSFTDRTGEVAFAVLMVIIINGYVALSNLNTGFLYIVVVNLGACAGWGIIDGLIYALSSSIERHSIRNELLFLKSCKNCDNLEKVKESLNDTFLSEFDEKGKEAVAKEIITHVQDASLSRSSVLTKAEVMGWLSIIGLYMITGIVLALPFLILPDKLLAWFISNLAGVIWLFWYGSQLAKVAGRNRWLFGLLLGGIGILFLVVSYLVWT